MSKLSLINELREQEKDILVEQVFENSMKAKAEQEGKTLSEFMQNIEFSESMTCEELLAKLGLETKE